MAQPATTTEITQRSTMNAEYPLNFCVATQNLILVTNGLQRPMRWNGMQALFDTAGVLAPTVAPAITPDGSAPPGAVTGGYTSFLRFVDNDGNVSNISPPGNIVNLVAKQVVYTNVQIPTETKVTRRQLLRNVSGETEVFYVDIDTTDLVSTTFTSNDDDSILINKPPVTILDADGSALAGIYDIPPNNKAVFISHLSRVFGAVEVNYDKGHIVIINGSTTVYGVNTKWTMEIAGRYIYVVGAPKPFIISALGAPVGIVQTLTLTEPYTGPSADVAVYAIRSAPGNERTLLYSEAGVPQGWPPTNSLTLNYTGDEITGLISKSSWIYVLERNHVHKVAYQEDPAIDGTVSLMAYRGCINQRCWQSVDNMIYLLDGQGVWSFDGQGGANPISMKVQELFRPDGQGAKINWKLNQWFHSSHDSAEETLRWYVVMEGTDYPKHAICYQYRQERWWIEDYPVQITASTVAKVNGTSESLRSLVGGEYARFYLNGFLHLDNCLPVGTMNGTVTAVTQISLTDSLAVFDPSVQGAAVFIVAGKGAGQKRIIVDVTPTMLTIRDPWLVIPDTTSEYQIGGINWTYKTGPFRWTGGEQWDERSVEMDYDPTDGTADLKLFRNRNSSPTPMVRTLRQQQDGVVIIKGQPEIALDMRKSDGHHWFRIGGGGEYYQDEDRIVSISLSGVGRGKPIKIHSISVGGASNG